MLGAIEYLTARSNEEWLVGYASQEFTKLAWQRYHALIKAPAPPTILLAERDPIRFMAGFVAACAANCTVFLANPDWVMVEWQQVWALAEPDVIWGNPPNLMVNPRVSPSPPFPLPPLIMVPTGGSSGQIRFAMHNWVTLMAAVAGFRDYFAVDRVNSVCVLPLYHASGLMQFLRSFTSGGQLAMLSGRDLAAGHVSAINQADFFLSLVPTQLHRLMVAEPEIFHQSMATNLPLSVPLTPSLPHSLTRFKAILLGGAPAWDDLLKQARAWGWPIAPTYGMTETAAQVATLKPADFLAGKIGCGQVLPHAQVKILSPTGAVLPAGQIGSIAIQATSFMLGYWPTPNPKPQTPYPTDDLGYLDPDGYLHIVGRNSQKIITGGENVFPAEVEAAIRATQLVADVCVMGQPDRQWGQIVTAVYVPTSENSETTLSIALEPYLSKFKRPKQWIAVATLPRNAQGKINFAQLEQIIRRN